MKPFLLLSLLISSAIAAEKPNIILIYADDISARELPVYGSTVWSPPTGGDTSDEKFRAKTPVLDKLAEEGCYVTNAWASVICSPSRAMMMTGRFAHLHKWWHNHEVGNYLNEKGKPAKWPLYKSSPEMLIGHVAQKGGYQTYWAGKTQMPGDLTAYGFHEGCFTPGNLEDRDNPFTDFKHYYKKIDGKRTLFNSDTDLPVDTYQQNGWYFYPHVRLMNQKGKNGFQWWPNTPESIENFGLHTYGPDVELDFIFEYMERQKADEKPFFIYHTTHLGHDAFDWLNPASTSKWPGTPVIEWDGEKYTRTQPRITGDKGVYDTHGTVTESGIHTHVNYLDYQVWLYQNKLEEMGIADNTILIFCADNGTSGYGKGMSDRSKGTHVPLIILAPGMTKQGRQDVLVSMADFLPTIADLADVDLPADFEISGKSLVPFLYGQDKNIRDFTYGYNKTDQIVRGSLVMKDGKDKWWDISQTPTDLISFPEINDWSKVSEAHRAERDRLIKTIKPFSMKVAGRDAPGFISTEAPKEKAHKK
ncbi:MAG: sulfatase-like hydrolase/transferase [Opitutales bacterium]|jgi:arylsulfatase A-like enzyme|nr:sulfatase-like hydrolase/transferase [Akkermansiaceae bacterium]MDP4644581.1 sulfatase-like hydrolase/transferase [Opitutales bacterium]MDP4721592.1 sulfatase-like hydrolase/transferase [Akkermansiaceae bacterium]MDP4779464.1 sulfatase-like hydrolase/transferase [Akkermansiaceae bacterium]MDP4846804.1 sulfatase-like hydrolase/transferase [Akkermansiaceae bacterium]